MPLTKKASIKEARVEQVRFLHAAIAEGKAVAQASRAHSYTRMAHAVLAAMVLLSVAYFNGLDLNVACVRGLAPGLRVPVQPQNDNNTCVLVSGT